MASWYDAQEHAKARGLRHLVGATRFSIQGLRHAITGEAAFRQELALACVLVPASFVVGATLLETAVLIGSVLLVLALELLNSGLEAIVDKASPEFHELAGRAKDLGSASIFVALIGMGTTWALLIVQNYF